MRNGTSTRRRQKIVDSIELSTHPYCYSRSASEAAAEALGDVKLLACAAAAVSAAVDAEAAAVEYSRGPTDVPIASAARGFRFGCCSGGCDC